MSLLHFRCLCLRKLIHLVRFYMTHSAFRIHFLGVRLSDSFQICSVPLSGDSWFLRHSCRWQPHQVHPAACLPVRGGRFFAALLCFAGISVSDDAALCLSPRALRFRPLSKHSMRLCTALTGGGGEKETIKPPYLELLGYWEFCSGVRPPPLHRQDKNLNIKGRYG